VTSQRTTLPTHSTEKEKAVKTFAMKRTALVSVGIVAAMALGACSAPQQGGSPAADTEGPVELPTSVTMTVPFSAGGGTDTWARVIAPYLQGHLEGEPNVVVENVEGGGSITGANQFVREGATDGSNILVSSGSTYLPQLLNEAAVEYDFSQMLPLVLNGTGGVVYAAPSTGIESSADLAGFEGELKYGGISATGLDLVTLLAMDVLGVEMDATFGFEGRGPARLAFERGEVNLDYQTTSAYNTQVQPTVAEGGAVPLFSFGVMEDGEIVRDPALPDLPTVEEVYEELNGEAPSGEAYDAYRAALVAGYFYQKGIWAAKDTPQGIVDAYRAAAAEVAEDEEFLAQAEEVLGGYPLIPGEEAQDALLEAFQIDDDVRQYMLDLLAEKYDTVVETK
jgi:tripartite-type tricarboxylate transporter receptor subunit TctC